MQAEVRGHQFRRQRAGAEHDAEAAGQVFHQEVEAADDVRARGAVQVVEDEDVFAFAAGQRGEEQAARRVRVFRLDPLAAAEEARFGARFEEVAGELVHGGVELVEGQPRDAAPGVTQAAEPLAEQRGLAVAGGGVHEGEARCPQAFEAFRFQAAFDAVRHRRAGLQLGAGEKSRAVSVGAHDVSKPSRHPAAGRRLRFPVSPSRPGPRDASCSPSWALPAAPGRCACYGSGRF